MIPFISHEDLGAYLDQTFTGGELIVKIALDGACEAVRQELHRTLNLVTDEDIVLDGNNTSTLILPQRPVHAIDNVTIDGEVVDADVIDLNVERGVLRLNDGSVWGAGMSNVALTYTHGYALDEPDVDGTIVRVPSNIRLVALRLAAAVYRTKGSSASGGAVTSETIGSYSYTTDVSAATDLAATFITENERVMLSGQRAVFAA